MAARGRSSSRARSAPAGGAGRDPGVDMLRGLALLLTGVSLCAPRSAPQLLVDVVDFATAPLFALLIGVGAQLGDRGSRALPAAFVRAGVRAAVLVALGFWLESWGAPLDVVLFSLALPTLLAPVLARLPLAVLLEIGTFCWAAGPALRDWGRARHAQAAAQGDKVGARLWDVVVAGPHYRLTTLLVFTCLGIVVWRAHAGTRTSARSGVTGLVAVVAAGGLLAARDAGRVSFEPLSGDRLEVFFAVLLVGGAAAVWFAVVPRGTRLPALAAAGSMSLSIYVVQVAYVTCVAGAGHRVNDAQSWINVAVLTLAALVLPMLWRSLVDRDPWARGPIEGATATVTRLVH